MTIAVAGATGQLGRLVIEKLKQRVPPSDIRALARSPEKGADLGVEVREADYERPETLGPALEGADTLLLISANEVGKRFAQHRNVIEAAKDRGVEWIVYTSLLRADSSPLSLAKEHHQTEEALAAAGMAVTVLRNGWYTENYTSSIPAALQGGALLGSASDGKISGAAREDYAQAAVAVLTGEGHHRGRTYELAGTEAWTLADLAAELSRQIGREIPYRNLPEAEYAGILEGFGLPADLAREIAGWDSAAAEGALYHDGQELTELTGRPATPLRQSIVDALRAARSAG